MKVITTMVIFALILGGTVNSDVRVTSITKSGPRCCGI